jgi:hydroxybutyrate-dimer hydrolase
VQARSPGRERRRGNDNAKEKSMSRVRLLLPAALCSFAAAAVASGGQFSNAPNRLPPGVVPVSSITYDGISDDLLTAGLGKTGLGGGRPAPIDPTKAADLRKLAVYVNYRAVLDINAAGGYGTLYGPNIDVNGNDTLGEGRIAGTEHIAVFDRGDSGRNVTIMVQVPASFDPGRACIVTGTSSGSRGVYGAIGSSGEWGLKRGCAVAYADKGTGNGVHDLQNNTVNRINGVRADAAAAGDDTVFTAPVTDLQRQQFNAATPNRYAVKHAHSQLNPEREWGQLTLKAVEYAFYVLNEKYGTPGPGNSGKRRTITPENTVVIASSISNGGGAALAAAEQDHAGLIDGVAVTEPNIQVMHPRNPAIRQGSVTYTGGSKPLYDYFTFANLYQACAALVPGAHFNIVNATRAANRCQSLADKGLLAATTTAAQAQEAMDKLAAYGWLPESAPLHASHWALATPAIAMTYSNAHGRFSVLDNLCGFSFAATDAATGNVLATLPPLLPTVFGDGNGVPPTIGINIVNNLNPGGAKADGLSKSPSTNREDFNVDGALCQRALWTGSDANAQRVQDGIAEVQQSGKLRGKPAIIVHGRADTLVPVNFSSRAYVAHNRWRDGTGSGLRYIEVTNAQHFDAFLGLAGYSSSYVPLHVYFNRAMDAMWAHLTSGAALPPSQVVRTTPRGAGAPPITAGNVPPIAANPAAGDRITFDGDTLVIPD